MDNSVDNAFNFIRDVADRFGWALNPDEKALSRLANHLAESKQRYGRYFCPCKQHYPLDPRLDPVCPCDEASGEIAQAGHCECHLFFDPESIQAKRRPGLLATITCPG